MTMAFAKCDCGAVIQGGTQEGVDQAMADHKLEAHGQEPDALNKKLAEYMQENAQLRAELAQLRTKEMTKE
jgi:regulator of replication initiation timing